MVIALHRLTPPAAATSSSYQIHTWALSLVPSRLPVINIGSVFSLPCVLKDDFDYRRHPPAHPPSRSTHRHKVSSSSSSFSLASSDSNSDSGASSSHSRTSSQQHEDIFQPEDRIGEGLMLQGEVLRRVNPDSKEPTTTRGKTELEVVRRLGAGSYAVVYLVREVFARGSHK